MNDLPLFAGRKTERQSTRRTTSDKAWEAVPRGAASLIHAHLLDRGPSTVEEIMDELALSHQTASSAVNRLMRVGWCIDAGLRVFNRTGREATAWVALRERRPSIEPERPTRRQLEDRVARAHAALLLREYDRAEAILGGHDEE